MNRVRWIGIVGTCMCLNYWGVICTSAESTKPAGPEEIRASLSSTNVFVRRAAATQLADNKPEMLSKEVLIPLVLQTLQDQDEEVRAMGAAAVGRVAYANPVNEGKRVKQAVALDLSDEARLREALLAATADKNADVRRGVIAALGLVFPPAPDIGNRLSEQYRMESVAVVRMAIVGAIGASGDTSSSAIDVLVLALQDDKAFVKQTAAGVIGDLRPPELWGKLIETFPGANLPVNETYLSAIQSYGTDAKALIPRLEQALLESKSLQAKIEQTLRKLKGEQTP